MTAIVPTVRPGNPRCAYQAPRQPRLQLVKGTWGPFDPEASVVFLTGSVLNRQWALQRIFMGDGIPNQDRTLVVDSPALKFCSWQGTFGLGLQLETLLPKGGTVVIVDVPASAGMVRVGRGCNEEFARKVFHRSLVRAPREVVGRTRSHGHRIAASSFILV